MRLVTLQRKEELWKDLALATICVGRVAWLILIGQSLSRGSTLESWKVLPSLWKEISWISVGSRKQSGEKESCGRSNSLCP